MNLATLIAVIALIVVVGLAVGYIVREKRRGSKCIGCPFAEGCERYGGKHDKESRCDN